MKAFYFTTALPTTLNPKNKKLYSRVMTFMKQRGRFINMERHNFLDRFISETRASTPGIGGHCQKIKGCDPNAVHSMRWHLKTRAMMQYLRESEKNSKSVAAMLKNSGAPVLDIKYDQLRSQPAAWCSVLNFLGISCADLILLHSSLKKVCCSSIVDCDLKHQGIDATLVTLHQKNLSGYNSTKGVCNPEL